MIHHVIRLTGPNYGCKEVNEGTRLMDIGGEQLELSKEIALNEHRTNCSQENPFNKEKTKWYVP